MLVCRCSMLKKCSHLALQHPGLLRHFSHLFRGDDNSLVLASCHTSLWTWRAPGFELALPVICIPTAMPIHAFRRGRRVTAAHRTQSCVEAGFCLRSGCCQLRVTCCSVCNNYRVNLAFLEAVGKSMEQDAHLRSASVTANRDTT